MPVHQIFGTANISYNDGYYLLYKREKDDKKEIHHPIGCKKTKEVSCKKMIEKEEKGKVTSKVKQEGS